MNQGDFLIHETGFDFVLCNIKRVKNINWHRSIAFCLTLCAALFTCIPGSLAFEATPKQTMQYSRYTTFYGGLENTARYATFPYDDTLLFEEPEGGYSPRLANASMALSAAAYSSENATALMSDMGFVRCTPWDYRLSSVDDNDFTGVCMGYKQVVRDGKTWDLFLITIQGTHGTYDWLSNFHFGDGNGVHAGFSQAKDTLIGRFRDYLKSLQTEGFAIPGGGAARVDADRDNNLIWITGHSRGGAVGNLLATELEGSAYVNGGNLRCYTFASPCVTSMPEAGERRGYYNFVNPGDFVTAVPLAQWGFVRYGKTIRLSDDPSWEAGMREGFARRTGWDYQGASEAENTELIGEVLELAPTVDDYYRKNYGLTLSQTILSRLTKALGIPFTPQVTCVANLFEGVAFAMAKDWLPAAGWGAVQAIQGNDYVNLLLRLFNSSKIEQGIPHAHSLESYLSWMAVLASATKETSDPGLPAYLSRLEVSGGTLSPTFEPGVREYTVSVPAGTGKVSVNANPASWYDLDAQESGKGKVVLEIRSSKLGIRESGKTKIDLTILNEGADLSLNVLTWETAEQTKYVLHFVREKAAEAEEFGESAVAPGGTVTFGRYEQDSNLQNGKEPIGQQQPINPGDFVTFGRYEQDNDLTNGQEAIKWQVLAVEGEKALLISANCLDNKPYISEPGNFSVSSFSLQEWLNDEFIQAAFSQEEQSILLTLNGEKPNENRTTYQNDSDRTFLLGIEEANRYFKNADTRMAPNTEYVIIKGAYSGNLGGYGRWWLRSAGDHRGSQVCVFSDGSLNLSGDFADSETNQVRPALYIDLNSAKMGVNIQKIQKEEKSSLPKSIPEKPSAIIPFGHYEQDANKANGKEVITWRVLALEGGKALLVSEKCLDCKPYDEEKKPVAWDSLQSLQEGNYNDKKDTTTWETCSLRSWLNNEFLNAAFTPEEQQAILTSDVINEDNPRFKTEAGMDTSDRVFLLSIADVKSEKYFSGDADRQAPSTAYAVSFAPERGHGPWGYWLRSPGYERLVATVENDGTVDIYGTGMPSEYYTIRPALYIDLSTGMF